MMTIWKMVQDLMELALDTNNTALMDVCGTFLDADDAWNANDTKETKKVAIRAHRTLKAAWVIHFS